jgi:hypothetical protein
VSALGRVLDPGAINALTGPSGRFEVRVPEAWAGHAIQVVVPVRVECSRCDGGGCDACARSGAIKLDPAAARRVLIASLPSDIGSGVALRLVHPFGEEGPLEILILELYPAPAPDPNVSLVPSISGGFRAAYVPIAVAVAIAAIGVALVAALR